EPCPIRRSWHANEAIGQVNWDALHARSQAAFDAVHRGSSLALQSGLYGTPPDRPDMTRALPNYEQRDPNELAMLRHREMVRPNAGRGDFTPEHIANMATTATMFSPLGASRAVGAVLAPEFMAGRAIAAGTHMAAQAAPRATTAALATGAVLAPSMTEGAENQQASLPKDSQGIKELQTKLKDAGLYRGEIDGIMRPGGPTEQALQKFREIEATNRAEELKRQELQTQQGANAAALETARANQSAAAAQIEAARLRAEKDAADLARRQEADQRLRDIDKDMSPASRIMRDYSGPAGIVLGAAAGSAGRWLTQSKADKAIKETAKAGNAIMAEDVAAGKKGADAALARATRANAFWQQGGAKEVPFLLEPGKAPGFAVNPKATPLNNTYSPQIHPAVEVAAAAPAALEWGISNHYKQKWEAELSDAIKAYDENPSEVNIQRITKAKDNVGLFTGLERFGQTALGVQAVGAVGSRYMNKGPDMRPRMQPAEAEQGSLQKVLRDAQARIDAAAEKVARKAGGKTPTVLEQRAAELAAGVGPPPPAIVGSAAWKARQTK